MLRHGSTSISETPSSPSTSRQYSSHRFDDVRIDNGRTTSHGLRRGKTSISETPTSPQTSTHSAYVSSSSSLSQQATHNNRVTHSYSSALQSPHRHVAPTVSTTYTRSSHYWPSYTPTQTAVYPRSYSPLYNYTPSGSGSPLVSSTQWAPQYNAANVSTSYRTTYVAAPRYGICQALSDAFGWLSRQARGFFRWLVGSN